MPKAALSLKSLDRRVRAIESQNSPDRNLHWKGRAIFERPELKNGETWAGVIFGKNGELDYHLVHISNSSENMPWQEAMDYAKKCGGEAPSLRDLALLRTNAREKFSDVAYWSCEQSAYDSDFAWFQFFNNGHQYTWLKVISYRGCVVRRIPIR